MANLRFVRDTKFPNTCKACGKDIPAHSKAFWDGAKANYHETCKPDAPPKAPTTAAGVGDSESYGRQPRKSNSLGSPAPAVFDVEGNLDWAMNVAVQRWGTSAEGIVIELMRERHALWMEQKIQANKERNMGVK